MPHKKTFPGQEPNEEVAMIIRKHWSAVITHIFIYFFAALIPPAAHIILYNFFFIDIFTDYTFSPLFLLVFSLYYLGWCLLFFKGWIDYYMDAWIITNQRLIDIEQTGFFNNTVAELQLDKIQDLVVEIKGFFPSMLHYGTIRVQTASAVQLFALENIPNPNEVRNVILRLQNQAPKSFYPSTPPPQSPNFPPMPKV